MTATPSRIVAVYLCGDSSVALTNEAMQEVNETARGIQRYRVYEITNPAHRYLVISVTPTFQANLANCGTWVAIRRYSDIAEAGSEAAIAGPQNTHWDAWTNAQLDSMKEGWLDGYMIKDIEWPGGRIVLHAAFGSTSIYRCATGNYYAKEAFAGGTVAKVSRKANAQMFAVFGEDWARRHIAGYDYSIQLDSYVVSVDAAEEEEYCGKNNLICFVLFKDETSEDRWEGYGYIANVDADLTPGKLIKEVLQINGYGELYRRM